MFKLLLMATLAGVTIGCGGDATRNEVAAPPTTPPATSPPTTSPPATSPPATSPSNLVGTPEDLRRHLKAEVAAKAPPDDQAKANEFAVDLHGVAAKVVWRTFEDGPNKYLLSVGLAVVTPVANVTVEAEPAMNPTNGGTENAIVEQIPLKLKWTHRQSSGVSFGEISVRIRADGTAARI